MAAQRESKALLCLDYILLILLNRPHFLSDFIVTRGGVADFKEGVQSFSGEKIKSCFLSESVLPYMNLLWLMHGEC